MTPEAMDDQSIYSNHALGERDIRLIRLEPAACAQDRIVASMMVVSLENPGKYHSISYAWESAVRDDYILCDGFRLSVTRNLHAGLKRIREKMAIRREDRVPPRTRFLPIVWADAICIDQSNDQEKARQVQMMSLIYLKASSLIIWLGDQSQEEDDELNAALAALRQRRLNNETTATLQALGRRSWFSRRWIIQEVLASNVRHVLSGGVWFLLDMLLHTYQLIPDLACAPFLEPLARRSRCVNVPDHLRDVYAPVKENRRRSLPPLLDNLIAYRMFACTDELDRVYALHSISFRKNAGHLEKYRPGSIPKTNVDYTLSPQQLYRRIAGDLFKPSVETCPDHSGQAHTARYMHLLRKLLIVATTTAYDETAGLPSWIPNWSIEPRCRSSQHETTMNMCQVATGFKKDASFLIDSDDDHYQDRIRLPMLHGDELHLDGWLFATCEHRDIACVCVEATDLLSSVESACE